MTVSRIVVGTDGSAGGARAVRWTAELAAPLGAEVVVVQAYSPLDEVGRAQPPIDFGALEGIAVERLRVEGCQALRDAGVIHRSRLIEDDAVEALVAVAQLEQADLIVVGSHGRTGWRKRVLGRVAIALPKAATVPVTIIPSG